MQIKLIIIILISFISISTMKAQHMQIKSKRSVFLGQQKKKYYKLDLLFNTAPEAYESYTKSVKKFKTAEFLGYSSIGSLGLGVVLLAGRGDNCRRTCENQNIAIVSILMIFPALGITGLIFNMGGKKHQKKAVDLYNRHQLIGIKSPPSTSQLKIGSSIDGLTLSLIF